MFVCITTCNTVYFITSKLLCVLREALAAVKAKEDYLRRHMAGETEQARADLARLAIVSHAVTYSITFII